MNAVDEAFADDLAAHVSLNLGYANPLKYVGIRSASTSTRDYVAIKVVIGDLHLSCELTSDREIRLAKRLADDNGIGLDVAPDWSDRVSKALSATGDDMTRARVQGDAP